MTAAATRPRIRPIAFALVAIASCSALAVSRAYAEPIGTQSAKPSAELFASDFRIDDSDPERSIPTEAQRNAKPIDFGNYLMLMGERADEASQRGNHAAAAKYYRALAKAVPDQSVAFTKLCAEYEATGERGKAEKSCGDALRLPGVAVEDFVHYVRLVLAQPSALSKAQIIAVDVAIAHLKSQTPALTVSVQLACDVGIKLNDSKRLAGCTSELHKRAPNDLKTISYEWAFALRRGDIEGAQHAVERAKQLGMRAEGVAEMEDGIRTATASPWTGLLDKPISALVAVAVVAVLFLLVRALAMRKRRALRQVSA